MRSDELKTLDLCLERVQESVFESLWKPAGQDMPKMYMEVYTKIF